MTSARHPEPPPVVRADGSVGTRRRDYSWEPFRPGHTLNLRHGAHSARMVNPVAAELVAIALEVGPWLAGVEYRPAVEAWARAEARALLVDNWLEEHGQLDDDGNPRPAAEYALRLERLAIEHRARLGLDPTGRAKLERDAAAAMVTTFDLDALAAEGRRYRLEAEARMVEEAATEHGDGPGVAPEPLDATDRITTPDAGPESGDDHR